jgi:hypothetical protein
MYVGTFVRIKHLDCFGVVINAEEIDLGLISGRRYSVLISNQKNDIVIKLWEHELSSVPA